MRDFPIYVAISMALISCSCADTAQLTNAFVFAYTKSRFSYDAAHLSKSPCAVFLFESCNHFPYVLDNANSPKRIISLFTVSSDSK